MPGQGLKPGTAATGTDRFLREIGAAGRESNVKILICGAWLREPPHKEVEQQQSSKPPEKNPKTRLPFLNTNAKSTTESTRNPQLDFETAAGSQEIQAESRTKPRDIRRLPGSRYATLGGSPKSQ